jgi:hypothetical protein
MSKHKLPWIALGAGLLICLVVIWSVPQDADGTTRLPLLFLLLLTEFGLIVTAIGAWLGGRRILQESLNLPTLLVTAGCLALAVAFLVIGISLWPGGIP